MDDRDFDLGKLPLMSGVPESCSMVDWEGEMRRLAQERDEARDLVRAAVQGTDLQQRRAALEQRYPWLKARQAEAQDATES